MTSTPWIVVKDASWISVIGLICRTNLSSVVLRKVNAFACRGVLFLSLFMGTMSEAQSAHIYFSETPAGRIGRANLDGTGQVTLQSGLALPVGPTLDLARGQMYWGEIGSRTMKRANLDGTGQTIIISNPNGGLPALDLAGGRMYWSVPGDGTLRRANLDGSGPQVLITGQNDPHAPVLDLVGGKIYWANFGVGDVRRANLDGTGQETLVGLASSSLLALDVAGGKMYWTVQRANGEIRRANLDGSSQETLVQGQNSPSGIALDINNGHIYWANNVGGDIRRANLDGTGQQILITGLSGLAVIALDLSVLPPLPPRPSITQFTPASGPPGTAVTILGANLGEGTAVRFNGITTTVLSVGPSAVVAVVPETATSGPISLATPGGTATSLESFTVTAAATQSSFTLQAGGAASSGTIGPSGSLRSGYANVAVGSGSRPYGTAVFSYTQNGVVVSEVGVPASPPTLDARIFVDLRANVPTAGGTIQINTGLAAVNTGAAAALVRLRLRDAAGAQLATGSLRLAPGAHLGKFLDQLAPDFVLPAAFLAAGVGSLEITSDQPLSILALRLTTNQRGDVLLTSTPVADLGQPAASASLIFSQVADGGGYQTALVFLNTSTVTERGTIRFTGSGGAPLTVRIEGVADTQFPFSIPPGGLLRLQTDGSPAAVQTGWARLTPDFGSPTPAGAVILSLTQAGNLVTESAVPAAAPTARARVYIDKSGGHDTGIAIANPGGIPLRVTLAAFETDGRTPAGNPGTLDLAAGAHAARFVDQLITGLPAGFTGVLEIAAASDFALLTLRSLTNSRGDFLLTTFPTADATRPAPALLVFPHVADGGGYQTQFIFLSTDGGASSVTLRYLGDDGLPIRVGR